MTRMRLPGGLRLEPHGRALRGTVVATALAIALAVLADLAFRGTLPADYVAFNRQPLWPRTAIACWWAAIAEVIYRLGLMTAIVALPALVGRRAGSAWIVFAIAAAQLVNVGALALLSAPYGMIRFWLVGCVWGWLYWRHGFACALAGHAASHIVLDPLLQAAL